MHSERPWRIELQQLSIVRLGQCIGVFSEAVSSGCRILLLLERVLEYLWTACINEVAETNPLFFSAKIIHSELEVFKLLVNYSRYSVIYQFLFPAYYLLISEQLMLVDSKLGQMGDQVQLVSPLWTFKEPTMLSLTYIMMGTDPQPPDSHAGLYLYQYSELHVPVRQLFNATSFKARDLQVSYVCVPSGTYHLMFLGVQGIPYESDFALDIVLIDKTCDYEEVKEGKQKKFNFNGAFADKEIHFSNSRL